MSNMIGGGAADQRGLLDHPDNFNDGGDGTPQNKRERIKGNQDLWLLNLFFKGCAFLV